MATSLEKALDQISNSDTIMLLAGAGMSTELGVPAWRTQEGSVYGSTDLVGYGLTALEHYSAPTLITNPTGQYAYHKKVRESLEQVDFGASYYSLLRGLLGEQLQAVVTTNIDSGFIRSGYPRDKVLELHGSYEFEQCPRACHLWRAGAHKVCPSCLKLARPNVLLFSDHFYLASPENTRATAMAQRVANNGIDTYLIIGAGLTIPTLYERVYHWVSPSDTVIIVNTDADQPPLEYPNQIRVNLSAQTFIKELEKRKESLT